MPVNEEPEGLRAVPGGECICGWAENRTKPCPVHAAPVPAGDGEAGGVPTPEEVLVEGSWFSTADLPRILGNFMRSSAEAEREAKELQAALTEMKSEVPTPEVLLTDDAAEDRLAARYAADRETFSVAVEVVLDKWAQDRNLTWVGDGLVTDLRAVLAQHRGLMATGASGRGSLVEAVGPFGTYDPSDCLAVVERSDKTGSFRAYCPTCDWYGRRYLNEGEARASAERHDGKDAAR